MELTASPSLKSRMLPTNTALAPHRPARSRRSRVNRASSSKASKGESRSSMITASAPGYRRKERHLVAVGDGIVLARVGLVDGDQHVRIERPVGGAGPHVAHPRPRGGLDIDFSGAHFVANACEKLHFNGHGTCASAWNRYHCGFGHWPPAGRSASYFTTTRRPIRAAPRQPREPFGMKREFIPVTVSVLTVSDSRTEAEDKSGKLLVQRLLDAGHRLHEKALCRDDVYAIRAICSRWIADPEVQ